MTRVNEKKRIPLAFLYVLAATAAGACTMDYKIYPIDTDDTDTTDENTEPTLCLAPDCPHIPCTFTYELDMAALESCYHYDPQSQTWGNGVPEQILMQCDPTVATCSVDVPFESDPILACAYHNAGDPFTGSCSYAEDAYGLQSPVRQAFEDALTKCSLPIAPVGACDELTTSSLTWNNVCDTCDAGSRVTAPRPSPPPAADLKLAIDPAKSFIRFVGPAAATTFPLAGAGLVDTKGTHLLDVTATTPGGPLAGGAYTGWTLSFRHAVDLSPGGDTFRISAADRPKITGRGRRDGKPVGLWAILSHDVTGHLHPGTKRWDLDFSDAEGSTALALHLEGATLPTSGAR